MRKSFWLPLSVILRDSVRTTLVAGASRVPGLLIPVFIAAFFGVSVQTDAFFLSYGIILFLAGIFVSVLETVTVPFIIENRANGDDCGKFISSILLVSTVCMAVLFVFFALISKPFIALVTDLDSANITLVVKLLYFTFPFAALLVFNSILKASLNAYKHFIIAAASPVIQAVCVLLVIFLAREKLGIYSIVAGYIAGAALQFLVLLWFLYRQDLFKLSFAWPLNSGFVLFAKVASFQLLAAVLLRFNFIVDRTMASWLDSGSISVLYYADRLHIIPFTLFAAGVLPVILSHWGSSHFNQDKKDAGLLFSKIKNTSGVILWISIPLVIVLIIFSKPLIGLIYNSSGKFNSETLSDIRLTWIAYAIGLVPQLLTLIFTQGYLILKKTAFLLKVAVFITLLNVILNYLLMRYFDVIGIAIATTLTHVVIIVLFCLFFPKSTKADTDNGILNA